MSEWQPIESAPKDGTRFLATWDRARYLVTTEDPVVVRWIADHWKGPAFYPDAAGTPYHVTHWMPLPPPPGEQTGIPIYRTEEAGKETFKGKMK